MAHDSLHDYRPDPEFKIESRLNPHIQDSQRDDAAYEYLEKKYGADSPKLKKAKDALKDFDLNVFYEELEIDKNIPKPLSYNGEQGGEGDPKDQWKALPLKTKISKMGDYFVWSEMWEDFEAFFGDNGPAGKIKDDFKPDNDKAWYKDFKLQDFFPYIKEMYDELPDYFTIKDYLLEGLPVLPKFFNAFGKVEVAEAKRPVARRMMWGFVAFRNTFINTMFKKLRDAGLDFAHKMVGSIDITSDYDATFGGADDVLAAYYFFQNFQRIWKVESAVLFDTNLYCRDWMLVKDQYLYPSKDGKTDGSLQVQVLDFIGDIYSLVKIRRYSSAREWEALRNTVKKSIKIPGLENSYYTNDDIEKNKIDLKAKPSGNSEIPLFHRFDLANEIYEKQFVKPLFKRAGDIFTKFRESETAKTLVALGKNVTKKTPRNLERLMEFDKNGMLRAMRNAYLELVAKLRWLEHDLRKYKKGKARWFQNDVVNKSALVEYKAGGERSGLSAEGLQLFIEQSSLLLSEAVLFANEAYNTQGPLWSVVGAQGGQPIQNLNIYHRLQSFNEQLGDALKELREHLREFVSGDECAIIEKERKAHEADLGKLKSEDKSLMDKALGEKDTATAVHLAAQQELERLKSDTAQAKIVEGQRKEAFDTQTQAVAVIEQNPGDDNHVQLLQQAKEEQTRLKGLHEEQSAAVQQAEANEKKAKADLEKKEKEKKTKEEAYATAVLLDENLKKRIKEKELIIKAMKKEEEKAKAEHRADETYTGFYRASKYEGRQKIELEEMIKLLNASDSVKTRIESYKELFPEKNKTPDEEDLNLLHAELAIAQSFDEYVTKLLDIRKARGDHAKSIKSKKVTASQKLVDEALKNEVFKTSRDDKIRKETEPIYGLDKGGKASKYNIPQAGQDKDWGIRHLIHHLLWHGASVNKAVRKILGRPPIKISVKKGS